MQPEYQESQQEKLYTDEERLKIKKDDLLDTIKIYEEALATRLKTIEVNLRESKEMIYNIHLAYQEYICFIKRNPTI